MPLQLTGPHWDFAVTLYGAEGVAEACLELQDAHGLDVPVLLVALFAARHHGLALEAADIAAADAVVRPWRSDVVVPLRMLRRRLKRGFESVPTGQAESLRTSIKEAELYAEQVEIAVLALWAASLPGRRTRRDVDLAAVVMRVVEVYAREAHENLDSDVAPLVARITRAAAQCAAR